MFKVGKKKKKSSLSKEDTFLLSVSLLTVCGIPVVFWGAGNGKWDETTVVIHWKGILWHFVAHSSYIREKYWYIIWSEGSSHKDNEQENKYLGIMLNTMRDINNVCDTYRENGGGGTVFRHLDTLVWECLPE